MFHTVCLCKPVLGTALTALNILQVMFQEKEKILMSSIADNIYILSATWLPTANFRPLSCQVSSLYFFYQSLGCPKANFWPIGKGQLHSLSVAVDLTRGSLGAGASFILFCNFIHCRSNILYIIKLNILHIFTYTITNLNRLSTLSPRYNNSI